MTNRSWNYDELNPAVSGFNKLVGRDWRSSAGGNTPFALRSKGQWQDNSYHRESIKISDLPLWSHHPNYPTQIRYYYQASVYGAIPYFEPIDYPDVGGLLANLLNKWRNSDFELGVTIGEGRESAQMIVERLASFGRAVRAIRQGNIRGAIGALVSSGGKSGSSSTRRAQLAAAAGNFSSAFLELELGWKPLLRDIYALADHIKVEGRKNIIRTSGKTKGAVLPSGTSPPGGTYGRNVKRTHLKVEVSSPPSEIERLGLTDPLSIGWNLTGLSFVADWFLPIGDTLQMWHALRAMPVTACVQTDVYERVGFGRVNAGFYAPSLNLITESGGQYTIDHLRMDRFVSTSPLALWGVLAREPRSVNPKWDPTLRRMGILSALVHQRILRL